MLGVGARVGASVGCVLVRKCVGARVGASVGCVLVRMCASVGFTPFVPTHPRDEGVVEETRGFIGERDL